MAEALRLHKYNSEQFTKDVGGMLSQSQIVQLNIKDGNEAGAEAAYARLLDVFSEQARLPDEVGRIADVYCDIEDYDKALELEQTIISKWPKTNSAMNAQLGIVKIHFARGSPADADTALDTLIAEYNDNTQLPRAVLMFGEGYYKKGLSIYQSPPPSSGGPPRPPNPSQADKDKSKENFGKSLAVWLKVAGPAEENSIKADYAMTAEYFHYAGTCYRLLGEYEKALEYYKKVVDKWPKYEAAWGVAGQIPPIYDRLKNEGLISADAADKLIMDAYQLILDRYPASPAAKIAQNKIENHRNPAKTSNVRLSLPLSEKGGAL